MSLAGLIPKEPVTWGKKSFVSQDLFPPLISSGDWQVHGGFAQGKSQRSYATLNPDVYVYWVDGDPQDKHYVVIVHLAGRFTAGEMMVNTIEERGFFQHRLDLVANLQSTIPHLERFSPMQGEEDDATAAVETSMDLISWAGGGPNLTTFTATGEQRTRMLNWRSVGRDAPGPSVWWTFHQRTPWDMRGKDLKGNYQGNVVNATLDPNVKIGDGNWGIRALPDTSTGTLEFHSLAVYRYPSTATDPATRVLSVTLAVDMFWHVALLHAPTVCGQEPRGFHAFPVGTDVFNADGETPYTCLKRTGFYPLDLHLIARQR